jgi:hypothetical protein
MCGRLAIGVTYLASALVFGQDKSQPPKPTGCGLSGSWMAEFIVRSDAGKHAAAIGLTSAALSVTVNGSTIALDSSAPQIRSATGTVDLSRCVFSAEGTGQAGGKSGVAFRITRGRLEGGFLSFELEIGSGGTLPNGPTTYYATAARQ